MADRRAVGRVVVTRKEGAERRETTPKSAISIGHLGARAVVVVVEAKGHPHEVLMSGSLNQPLLAVPPPPAPLSPPTAIAGESPEAWEKLSRHWVGRRGAALLFSQRIAVSFFPRVATLPSPNPWLLSCDHRASRDIIPGSVHKNRGKKDPFSRPRRR
jgi:hypothetical protein